MSKTTFLSNARAGCLLTLSAVLVAGCGGGSDADADQTSSGPAPAPVSSAPDPNPTSTGGTATSTGAPQAESSDSEPTRTPGSTGASDSPGPEKGSAAEVDRLAKAGLLVAADLPGFTGQPLAFDGSEEFKVASLYQCLRSPRPVYVSRNPGTSWVKGTRRIDSSADVVRSAATAKQNLTASKSPFAASCYAEALLRLVEQPGSSTGAMADPASVKVKNAEGAFGVKFTLTASTGGQTRTLTGFLVGAVVDTVEITVIDAVSDGPAPTLSETAKLAEAAVARVRAAQRN